MSEHTLPDNDEAVMMLVTAALGQPPSEREPYLRQACRGDTRLFRQSCEYLHAEEQMQGFLSDPLVPRPSDEPPLEAGDLLAERFRILRSVGEGGMAYVYEAYDLKLERRVAVKWPKGAFRKRVPPEVRHAREISHPNVGRIFDIHTVSHAGVDIDFLTMEFLDGETLSQRLARRPVPRAEVLSVALQLCAGLAEAHRNDVVHGDLKTNNIILSPRSDGSARAVITDFGLARKPGSAPGGPAFSTRGGTPDYMAPELWRGEGPTRASDIYALGVILHELATGGRPGSETAKPEQLDTSWRRTVARCLLPDPAARYQSADEVAAALGPKPTRRIVLGLTGSAVAATAGWGWLRTPSPAPGALALIPFANSSGRPEADYLSDGISESLINALSAVPHLRVISRTSSARFRGAHVDLRKAGRALGVRSLITGSVSNASGAISVAVELIDVRDGARIWGSRYQTAIASLRSVEAEILREVVTRTGSTLSQAEWKRLAAARQIGPEAYGLLLQGRYHMQLYTPESRQKALQCFQQAVAVDPGSALAHAELARAYRLLGGSAVENPRDVLPKAEAASQRALALDNDLAEAQAALADIRKDQWRWKDAESAYIRATAINPNLVYVRQGYAIFLTLMHRFAAAVSEIQRAAELDPFGLPTAIHTAAVRYNSRRFPEAMQTLQRASQLDPSAPSPWTWTGMSAGAMRDWPTALAAYDKAVKLGDDTAATQCFYAHALAASGNRARAIEITRKLEQSSSYFPPSALAIAYSGLDRKEQAFVALRKAFESRDPFLQYLDVEAHFDSLRGDPRFSVLRHEIGLPG